MLPCDAQKLLNSGSGYALMPDVHVLDVEEDLLPPILLTRAPGRSLFVLHCSHRSAKSPELQAQESWAALANSQARDSWADLDKSSAGEMPCRFALRWRCFGARRKLASLTCIEALAWDCLAEAAGVVAETATCPKVAEQRWNLLSLCR